MFEPLYWPQCWVKRNALQRLLTGCWFVGNEKRTYKEICLQLDCRDASYVQAWDDENVDMSLLAQVSGWINEYFHWPNDYFVPGDPMNILTWDYQGIVVDYNLSYVRLLMDIDDNFGEVLPDDRIDQAASRGTYGEFMRLLTEIRKH